MVVAAPIAILGLLTAVALTLLVISREGLQLDLTPGRRRIALAAAVIVPAVVVARLTSTSGFVWDDIKNLREAQVARLSFSYLLEPTSGHFAPGHRLADWVFFHLFSFDFGAAVVIMAVGFAFTLILFHRILVELFRPGAGPLVLTLIYAVSAVHVAVTQWWASGMDRLPATILSFIAILGYLRYYRTRAWPMLAMSAVSLALAELFYVKPVFVPLYLVLMRVLLLEPDRPLRETVIEAAREWRVWLLYGVIAGVFAVVYQRAYPSSVILHTTPEEFAQYLSTLWFRVLVPNFFGFWTARGPASAWTWAGATLAQLLLVGLVVWSIWRWRPAWRAWTFFLVGFIANAVIVGAVRVGPTFGEIIAYSVWYNLEFQILFVLALGFAFLRPRAASALPDSTGPPAVSTTPDLSAGLAIGLAAYVALSWSNGYRLSQPEHWAGATPHGALSRLYLDRASEGMRALRRSVEPAVLVDEVVPEHVVPYAMVPYNSGSEVFPLLDEHVMFDASRGHLYGVGPDGTVRPVSFVTEAGGDSTLLLQRQLIGVLGATSRLEGGSLCATAGRTPATIGVVLPSPLSGDALALRLRYDARTDAMVAMLVDPQPAQTTGLTKGQPKLRVVNVSRGEDQVRVFALDAPEIRGVYLVLSAGVEMCIDGAELGRLVERNP